jgi:hypothetical protein
MRSGRLAVVALLLALGLTACGENKVQFYEQGKYKGAAVEAPWNAPQFGGNRASWESQVAARARNQDEYVRMRSR